MDPSTARLTQLFSATLAPSPQRHGCVPSILPGIDGAAGDQQPKLGTKIQWDTPGTRTQPNIHCCHRCYCMLRPSCHPVQWFVWLRTDVVRLLVFNYQTKAESCIPKMKSWHTLNLLPYQASAIIIFGHEEGEKTVKLTNLPTLRPQNQNLWRYF